jgi:rhodanese-related sulfurtransferase
MKQVLAEAALVLLAGSAFGLFANAISPRGLKLTRDYFPAATPLSAAKIGSSPRAPATNRTEVSAAGNPLERFRLRGLQPLNHAEVAQLFQSPDTASGQIVFVDARDDQHYQAGHIPGAWQFDHYRPEQYLAGVLPVCQLAGRVVVYCTGGDCEDSEFALMMLNQAGVPREKLFIYAGGITDWKHAGQPVETGQRGSGILAKPNP